MHQALEHQEHAEHAAAHGSKHAALIVAVLAALLAITEQQAKHAEIGVQTNAVLAADSWAQYQAKSIRQMVSTDLSQLIPLLGANAEPALLAKRAALAASFGKDAAAYDRDPQDGKKAIAERAHRYEELRGAALERSHTFDNSAAALELGIVLATASAITASGMLVRFSLLMGAVGLILGIIGFIHPEYGAF
jgi:hypothetical protein